MGFFFCHDHSEYFFFSFAPFCPSVGSDWFVHFVGQPDEKFYPLFRQGNILFSAAAASLHVLTLVAVSAVGNACRVVATNVVVHTFLRRASHAAARFGRSAD